MIGTIAKGVGGFLLTPTGLLILAFGGLIVFYEGLPLGPLRWIPFVGPVLEEIADGRVDRERRAGVEAGRREERIMWEEARARLLAQMEERRKRDQAEIDRLAADYFNSRGADAVKIAALEEALAAERSEDETSPACAARPAFSRRVSGALNQIGRD